MIGLDRKAKPEIREKANIKMVYKALLYLDNKWMVRQ